MGLAIDNFERISKEKWLKLHSSVKPQDLEHWIYLRDVKKVPCIVCGNTPIWAACSCIVEWAGCFSCITGESDASEDYEVE
jgi:hypothetical protein